MKLFWRDHAVLLIFTGVQAALVPLLYWLSGDKRPPGVMLYGALLIFAVLAVYLVVRYATHRELYLRLDNPGPEPGFGKPQLGAAPLAEAVSELAGSGARAGQERLQRYISAADQHNVFLNRWVHQMKTPLSVIQLTIQERDDPEADSIQEELDKLRSGLEMVLHLSRLERFEADFSVHEVKLRQLVNEAVAENRRLFIAKGLAPDIRIPEQAAVYSDAKWLKFIVGQIIVNAINYSAGKGKTVEFALTEERGRTALHIRDQGIGIEPADLKRVFNPYFTGEQGRKFRESTGMGLYLVKEVCARLGHEANIVSRPGEGTTLSIVFGSKTGPRAG